MKAPDFIYRRPTTIDEALSMLGNEEAMPLAGGQSLMPMMNFRLTAPQELIDLNRVSGLDGIEIEDGSLKIGAMTRYRDLAESTVIADAAPLMAKALPHIAHPAIRNRGTIGGSCALADPAAEMPALLLAMGAEIEVRGQAGSHRIAARDFFLGLYETALEPGELLVAVHIPAAPQGTQTGFYEVVRRHGDYAMAGCAMQSEPDQLRIAFFGISDRAVRATDAEKILASGEAVDAAVASLSELEIMGDLHTDEPTKRHLAGVALRRAWAELGA